MAAMAATSDKLLVLYRISNDEESPSISSGLYNAFEMPRDYRGDGGSSVTLAAVKSHCRALRVLSHAGPDGYHWRVRVDEKFPGGTTTGKQHFSWWDIQDENARLPVKKNATLSEVEHLYMKEKSATHHHPQQHHPAGGGAASEVRGAIRSLGKAMMKEVAVHTSHAEKQEREDPHAPRVSVIAFKLLDMVKVHRDYDHVSKPAVERKARTRSRPTPTPKPAPAPVRPRPQPHKTAVAPAPAPAPAPTPQRPKSAPIVKPQHSPVSPRRSIPKVAPPPKRNQQQHNKQPSEKALMDFSDHNTSSNKPTTNNNNATANRSNKPTLHHSLSSPIPESRPEKLKRQYKQNAKTQNRVWDDVDQRWVAVDDHPSQVKRGTVSTPPSSSSAAAKNTVKGINIDPKTAVGKSREVQHAVNKRYTDMKTAQKNAIQELKQREQQKKDAEEEEDLWRRKLEPKLKAWSEEHGKKKQLRALLASLHMILWEDCGWKQISLGDVLDEKQARRVYKKATLKVHPDRVMDLDAEKRFIAKRVFDALAQAMTEFEKADGAN